ncbi:nose resistant to fluoxetine protein 6-like isoform X2 [Haemaphysalis longicornis]
MAPVLGVIVLAIFMSTLPDVASGPTAQPLADISDSPLETEVAVRDGRTLLEYTGASPSSADASAPTTVAVADIEEKINEVLRKAMLSAIPVAQQALVSGAVSTSCFSSLVALSKALASYEIWALKFIDSMGLPSGVLELSSGSLGNYDECMSIAAPDATNNSLIAFRGSYCSAYFKPGKNPFLSKLARRTYHHYPALVKRFGNYDKFALSQGLDIFGTRIALCVPSTCSVEDVAFFMKAVAEPYGVLTKVSTCSDASPTTYTAHQLTAMYILACTCALVIISSAVDLCLRYSSKRSSKKPQGILLQLLLAFSAVSNSQRLFSSNFKERNGKLRCIEGMRFFSAAWILAIHNYFLIDPHSIATYLDLLALKSSLPLTTVYAGFLSVETFFLISGFMVSYGIFKEREDSNVSTPWLLKIWRRYIRLAITPFFLVLVLLIYPIFLRGPVADQIKEDGLVKPCQKHWWRALLHLINIGNMTDMCTVHLWYLSCDFQIYLICFGFIVLMKRKPIIGGACLATMSLAALVAVGFQIYTKSYVAFVGMVTMDMRMMFDYVSYVYIKPHQHMVSFVMGTFAAYFFVYHKPPAVTKVCTTLSWTLAAAVSSVTCLVPHVWESALVPYDPALGAVYAALYPLLWSTAVSWMLYACITGMGGPVNRFLCLGLFMPLGKLSFSLYLVHPLVLAVKLMSTRVNKRLDQWTMFTDASGLLTTSLLLAYIFYLVCECPVINLDKIMLDAFLRGRKKRREMTREHLNSAC